MTEEQVCLEYIDSIKRELINDPEFQATVGAAAGTAEVYSLNNLRRAAQLLPSGMPKGSWGWLISGIQVRYAQHFLSFNTPAADCFYI